MSGRRACWHHTGDAHHTALPCTRALGRYRPTCSPRPPSCPREPETGRGAKALRAPSFCLNRASTPRCWRTAPILECLCDRHSQSLRHFRFCLALYRLPLGPSSLHESFSPLLRMPLPRALEPLSLLQNFPDRSFHLTLRMVCLGTWSIQMRSSCRWSLLPHLLPTFFQGGFQPLGFVHGALPFRPKRPGRPCDAGFSYCTLAQRYLPSTF